MHFWPWLPPEPGGRWLVFTARTVATSAKCSLRPVAGCRWPCAASRLTGDLRFLLPANCCSDFPVQILCKQRSPRVDVGRLDGHGVVLRRTRI